MIGGYLEYIRGFHDCVGYPDCFGGYLMEYIVLTVYSCFPQCTKQPLNVLRIAPLPPPQFTEHLSMHSQCTKPPSTPKCLAYTFYHMRGGF